jgi:cardiolipin synthase
MRNSLKKALIVITSALFFSTNLVAAQPDTEYLPASKYYEAALTEISNAKSTIQVFMYLISVFPDQPNSQSTKLVEALANAKARGVDVKVTLDQNIDFLEESREEAIYQNKNQEAYELLKRSGVPVFFDEANTYTHAKAIVIDGETVILGSTNWSKAALTKNHEASALIRSKEFAQSLLADMSSIKIQEVPAVLTPTVSIPKEFLLKESHLGEMVSQADERVFDVYLYLLSQHTGSEDTKLTLNYEKLAASLGIDQMTKEDYRRQITKVLQKLKDKYRVINFENPDRGQDAVIQFKEPVAPETNTFQVPAAYWKYGYNRTLPFPAKVMHLIVLSYTSQASPSFFMSRETLSKKHHISESFISDGTRELRKRNLLDIEYGEIEGKSYSQRPANVYTPKPFYDPKDLEKDLKGLEEKYGREALGRALSAASIIFEENNSRTLRALIELENNYGEAIVKEASAKLAEKNPDNPKRSAGYLINTVKSIAVEKTK